MAWSTSSSLVLGTRTKGVILSTVGLSTAGAMLNTVSIAIPDERDSADVVADSSGTVLGLVSGRKVEEAARRRETST